MKCNAGGITGSSQLDHGEEQIQMHTDFQRISTYMKIVRFIATLRIPTLITFFIWCIGAVAGTKGINRTGWSLLRTIHATIVRTTLGPTIGVASFVGRVGAITIPGWTNIAHWLFLGALCSLRII